MALLSAWSPSNSNKGRDSLILLSSVLIQFTNPTGCHAPDSDHDSTNLVLDSTCVWCADPFSTAAQIPSL